MERALGGPRVRGRGEPRRPGAEGGGLRAERIDLAIDLQGDVRAAGLMALTGARERVGYANTGGARLLTRVVPLDETVSWIEQNRDAIAVAAGSSRRTGPPPRVELLTPADRERAAEILRAEGLEGHRPLVGLHASGGRPVKQWGQGRWREVAGRLQREFGAAIVLTGSEGDRPLAQDLARGLPGTVRDLSGRLALLDTLALVGALDLFLSSDTGPMHMAAAVATPSVSVFGPSDARRYFSGGTGAAGTRHVVAAHELWCAPCNLIRRPPEECLGPEGPECLRLVTADEVHHAAASLLASAGFARDTAAR